MNKVVVVTGGTRGIGEAISREFAKNGYDIVINFVNSEEKGFTFANYFKYGNLDVPRTLVITPGKVWSGKDTTGEYNKAIRRYDAEGFLEEIIIKDKVTAIGDY